MHGMASFSRPCLCPEDVQEPRASGESPCMCPWDAIDTDRMATWSDSHSRTRTRTWTRTRTRAHLDTPCQWLTIQKFSRTRSRTRTRTRAHVDTALDCCRALDLNVDAGFQVSSTMLVEVTWQALTFTGVLAGLPNQKSNKSSAAACQECMLGGYLLSEASSGLLCSTPPPSAPNKQQQQHILSIPSPTPHTKADGANFGTWCWLLAVADILLLASLHSPFQQGMHAPPLKPSPALVSCNTTFVLFKSSLVGIPCLQNLREGRD